MRFVSVSSKSEKDGIELETGVSVGDISALEIQELFNVKKLHDYEESIHHEIKGGKVPTDQLSDCVYLVGVNELVRLSECASERAEE